MPELPEVETTRCGIEPWVKGKTIQSIDIRQPKLRFEVPKQLIKLLKQQKINGISRRGKYLGFHTANGCFIIHLGMSGQLRIQPKHHLLRKHDHVIFRFKDISLIYNDPRRFGCILWAEAFLSHPLIAKLGVEPLSRSFHTNYLYSRTHTSQKPIKRLLMDHLIVVGVGNIYANEALYIAHISPMHTASSLSLDKIKQLVTAIKAVLKRAIKAGGTTLKDFASNDKKGYFQFDLQVYNRENLPCLRDQTPIIKTMIGQRATYFCPTCQH